MLALALAAVTAAPPQLPDAPVVESTATHRLIVRCSAAEFETLRAELRTRWPDAEVLPYGPAAFERVEGQPFSYLEIVGERVGDAPVAITLVLSDGRAYLRRVVLSDAERARVLAVAIANLLGAVEDEDVPPDRINVEVPTPLDVPGPAVEPEPEPPVAVEPTPTPTPTPPLPLAILDDEPEPTPERGATRRVRRPASDPWRLGARAGLGLLVGLGPRARWGRPAFGGELAVDARAPRGLALGAALRVVGDGAQDFALVRTRLAPSIGYVGRVRQFEYAVGAGPTLEPWRLRSGGDGRTLASRSGRSWTVLYGGAIHAAAGWWTRLRTRAPSSLRLGVRADVAVSGHASGKAVVIRTVPMGPKLFALGGFELALTAEATWWFDLRPRGAKPRPSGSPTQ
jgi:hypothetical protein